MPRARAVCVASVLWALSGSAAAQDGLRSASLPERAPEQALSGERDLFRVPPDFYHRPPDPDARRLFFPAVPIPVYWPIYVPPPSLTVEVRSDRLERRRPVRAGHRPLTEALPPATVPPPPGEPGPPKTFYVIPGCYAGDRLPEPAWLGPGCDRSKLKVVPPA